MNLLPVNIATVCTGHKLQGRSKDTLAWPKFNNNVVFQNWEYIVLSRVRTLNDLFLLKPLNMQKKLQTDFRTDLWTDKIIHEKSVKKDGSESTEKKKRNNIAEFENYLTNNNQNNT